MKDSALKSYLWATVEMRERILLACHTFPPYRGIGGRRWAKFAKALARRGFTVHVICAAGGEELKGSSWSGDTEHENIHLHELPFKYPKIILKRKHQDISDKIKYHAWLRLLPLLTKGNYFDKSVFWENQFKEISRSLIREHGIKHFIVTGAPFRILSFAADLKQEFTDLKLICDLRDAWTHTRDYGLDSVRNKRKEFESESELKVMRVADKVIYPHPMVIDHILKQGNFEPSKFMRLRHAVDPDDIGSKSTDGGTNKVFRTMYAGSMYGADEARVYFDEVIKAYMEIKRRQIKARLDLYITQHNTIPYEEKIRDLRLDGHIFFHDPVPAKEVFRRMHHSDMVQLFIPNANRDLMGTKFTEIFHLRKPLLHVGPEGYVSDYINQHKLGLSLRVAEVATRLPEIISRNEAIEIDETHDLSEHSLEFLTDRLLNEILEIRAS